MLHARLDVLVTVPAHGAVVAACFDTSTPSLSNCFYGGGGPLGSL